MLDQDTLGNIVKGEAKKLGVSWMDMSGEQLMKVWDIYKDILPYKNVFEFIVAYKKLVAKEKGILVIPSSVEIISMDCEIEWLIDKVLPKQAISLLFGKGGIGKTWLALQLSRAIAEGMPFLGFDSQKTTVVYINFEDPLSVLKKRLETIGTSPDFYIWHLSHDPSPPKLDSRRWELYKKLPQESLLIFVTLRAAHGGDENSSLDMAKIMERLKELRELGYTILLLHHTPKSSSQIYKGSTAIVDLVDHALCLEKDGDSEDIEMQIYRLGTKEKTRFLAGEIFLSFNGEGFELAQDPRLQKLYDLYEIIKQKEGTKLSQQDIINEAREQLGWSKNKTLEILKKGEGTFWQKQKGQGHKFYYIPLDRGFSNFPHIYNIRKSEDTPNKAGKYPKENQEKTLTSSKFSNFPHIYNIGKLENTPNRDEDQNEDFEYDL